MKITGSGRSHLTKRSRAVLVLFVLLFLAFSTSSALCASGEGGTKGWVSTDTFRVMNFAVLVVALIFVLRKPLSQALSSRIKTIKEQLDDLEAQKADAEKQLADYNDKLAQLEKEAEKIVEDYVRQGNEAKARILKEAEASAAKLQDQARRNIEHEFKQAKLELQKEIFEKSLVKAEEIIKSKISDNDQDRIVDEYLKKVVAG
ncbi:MAG: F0F1 ATP synthase subunit B [Desulfobacterales bacterium]